jgi:hypothetical protein
MYADAVQRSVLVFQFSDDPASVRLLLVVGSIGLLFVGPSGLRLKCSGSYIRLAFYNFIVGGVITTRRRDDSEGRMLGYK